MKQNIADYIRQNEDLRKILLAQDGGILKYWAEHPDADFDGTLFEGYEKEMVQEYLRVNKRNRALASLSEYELKQKARDSYCYEKGSEIHFYTIVKPTLDKLSAEVSAQAFDYVNDYLVDAFKESRRALYPDGIPPRKLYKEVIGAYDPTFGLAGRCMWRVLKEHWGKTEAEKDEFVLQTEFDIRLYSRYYFARTEMLRQAVKEMIDKNIENKTEEECRNICRRMAINAMREVKSFSHLVNGNNWTETYGVRITAEDKRWLRFGMNYLDSSDNANEIKGMTPMQECFQLFYHIFEDIGRFWAAQLLQRGIDMKELEKDLGGIFVHDNDVRQYFYYVDRLPCDQYGDCCVFDMNEAKTLIESLRNKGLQSIEAEETDNMTIGYSALDMISANNIEPYYEGWRNGKRGAISQEKGIYRFIEQKRGKSGTLDRVHYKTEDNPIVAIGIVAVWLIFKQGKNPVLQRLTKYNYIPESMLEMFEIYTKERYDEFRKMNRDNPDTLDWDWDFEFYTNYIIPHELDFNKQSEALFDYISDSEIALVRSVMNKYIKYLKKIRTEKGYQVNPELLVLRAIDSRDEKKQEDLEEFEVNAILEDLEKKGCIKVCWILGHKPWSIALLDKGRCYLKQLEEGNIVVETKPIITPHQPQEDNTTDILPQTQNSSVREITWAERKQCFKTAVLIVMEKRKADGDYLFENNSQWMAVYRFAIDLGILYDVEDPRKPKDTSTPQYALFTNYAHELQFDENPPTRLPFTKKAIDSINSKPNYARFNASHPWSHEGISDPRSLEFFIEMDNVYLAIEEEYENLVSQAKKVVD